MIVVKSTPFKESEEIKLIKRTEQFINAGKVFWTEAELLDPGKAVKWAENEETGELAIFTRGEYASRLKEFVVNLDINQFPKEGKKK
jgi:hypothetical protein